MRLDFVSVGVNSVKLNCILESFSSHKIKIISLCKIVGKHNGASTYWLLGLKVPKEKHKEQYVRICTVCISASICLTHHHYVKLSC